MKFYFRYLAAALLLIVGGVAAFGQWSQKKVGSDLYDAYTVRQGQTIYSLSKSLGLSPEQIKQYNPDVAQGLKAGAVLYFPQGVVTKHDADPGAVIIPENVPTTIHEVQKKESVYGIAKHYGITIEQLFALNPSAKEGIKKGEKLIIPIFGTSDQSASEPSQSEAAPYPGRVNTDFYTVRNGDTFYSIAWNHGMSQQELENLNPEVSPERIQQGQLLRLRKRAPEIVYNQAEPTNPTLADDMVVSNTTPEAQVPAQDQPTRGDQVATLVDIDASLQSAQDAIAVQQRGGNELASSTPQQQTGGPVYIDAAAFEQFDTIGGLKDKPLSIVVMLPFMLNESTPSKLALRYLDFYKGLLIAADSLSRNGQKPVKIVAYDTEGSTDRVRALLDEAEVANASVVIAPDADEQLQLIAQKGDQAGFYTFNIYNVKDESYLTNPRMMQANINHRQMYHKAIEAMERRYPNNTLVILNNDGGRNEKMEFVETVRQHYHDQGKEVLEITYKGNLPSEVLDSLSSTTPYIFLPVSGSNQEFGRIYPALKYFRENVALPSDVVVFGYPDWSAFRADRLEELHRLNAVIYSRFYDDVLSPQSQGVGQAFTRWYGEEMEDGVPKPGLMGFDVGTYLINALRMNNGDFNQYTPQDQGVQSTFRFSRPSQSKGLVNDALYIVDFNGDGTISKTVN